MRISLKLFLLSLLVSVAVIAQDAPDTELTQEQIQQLEWQTEIWEGLDRMTGEVVIEQANARLNIPENFYFLGAKDAETVLVDVWGNPPGQDVLGMLFPSEYTPFDIDSWAVTLQYEEDGYVSDADAHEINYDELLTQMQADTLAASEERVKQGYDEIELVGWAAKPYYDAGNNKLHWAKELRFGTLETNTLNYNIRVLGRKGVLVLNFVAQMEQLPTINENLDTVLALADFQDGSRYQDFNPDIDEVAAYGVGALVAGKVIAKTGFLAVLIMFLKKFGVFIFIGIGVLFKKLFFDRKKASAES